MANLTNLILVRYSCRQKEIVGPLYLIDTYNTGYLEEGSGKLSCCPPHITAMCYRSSRIKCNSHFLVQRHIIVMLGKTTQTGLSEPKQDSIIFIRDSLFHKLGEGWGYPNDFLTVCAARGLKPLPISKDFSPLNTG